MFLGLYKHSLDEKNRVVIPAKIKIGLEREFVMYCPPNDRGCIYLYPFDVWEEMIEQTKSKLPNGADPRDIMRDIFSFSETANVDNQGRMLIKQDFLKTADITKDVCIQGVGKYVEIWNADVYEANHKKLEDGDSASLPLMFI